MNEGKELDLMKIRQEIDFCDAELVKLFEQRIELSIKVADYKHATGKAIYDEEREKEKLDKIEAIVQDKDKAEYIRDLFKEIMANSRRIQLDRINNK